MASLLRALPRRAAAPQLTPSPAAPRLLPRPRVSPAAHPSSSLSAPRLSHLDARGDAAMVDTTPKHSSARTARAAATVRLGAAAFAALDETANAKGSVLVVARIAGIMAAKRTAELLPLCHPLSLSHVAVTLRGDAERHEVHIEASASCVGATGVEMEALTAASVAALTVYDMCKAASKAIVISDVRLLEKTGGRSGVYRAESA
ncbi:hypothetical protein AB1Y20_003952 [Prymnesium parvum]|uniref:cyclic pyranopterin monophosphate synthase n=1 Tax=Prymnesium parvum TaxID=97485 RepID=A0AB34J8G8_PRYPA